MSVFIPKIQAKQPSDKESLSSDSSGSKVDEKKISKDDLSDTDPQPFKLYDYLFRRDKYKGRDLDSIATRRSVYDDPNLASHYWPKAEYENIHRFDPDARWTVREERVSILFSSQMSGTSFICAVGISQENRLESHALGGHLVLCSQSRSQQPESGQHRQPHSRLEDDHEWCAYSTIFSCITYVSPDFNMGNTVFRLAFLFAELPSQLISKKVGSKVLTASQ